MPFCPKCKYEYKAGTAACPDCGEKLVDKLPEPVEDGNAELDEKYKNWVPLARIQSTQMAEMILESLRVKDIPAVIHSGVGYFGQVGTQGLSSYAPVGGGYSIMVSKEYVADAVEEVKLILGDDWEKAKLVDISQ
jgi:hypothetical protein